MYSASRAYGLSHNPADRSPGSDLPAAISAITVRAGPRPAPRPSRHPGRGGGDLATSTGSWSLGHVVQTVPGGGRFVGFSELSPDHRRPRQRRPHRRGQCQVGARSVPGRCRWSAPPRRTKAQPAIRQPADGSRPLGRGRTATARSRCSPGTRQWPDRPQIEWRPGHPDGAWRNRG